MDAMEIERIADSLERYGDRFLRHVFTEGEIAYCRRKRDFASSFAARFAAKEAHEGARHGVLARSLLQASRLCGAMAHRNCSSMPACSSGSRRSAPPARC